QTRQPTPAPPKIPPKAARLENQQWSACPQAGRRAAQHPIAQEPRSPPPQKGRFCNSARGSHQQIILCCRNAEVRRQTRSCKQERSRFSDEERDVERQRQLFGTVPL